MIQPYPTTSERSFSHFDAYDAGNNGCVSISRNPTTSNFQSLVVVPSVVPNHFLGQPVYPSAYNSNLCPMPANYYVGGHFYSVTPFYNSSPMVVATPISSPTTSPTTSPTKSPNRSRNTSHNASPAPLTTANIQQFLPLPNSNLNGNSKSVSERSYSSRSRRGSSASSLSSDGIPTDGTCSIPSGHNSLPNSRQKLISRVYPVVQRMFEDYIVAKNVLVRGDNTLFIPVKTMESLKTITEFANDIFEADVRIKRASFPMASKKGFLMFLDLYSQQDVEKVKQIFNQKGFSKVFKCCSIAEDKRKDDNGMNKKKRKHKYNNATAQI